MNITNASESLKTNQADSEFSCPLLDRFLKESAGYMDTVYIANCAINAIFSFTAVIANGLIMLSIWRAPSLRTPTYYFLFGLAMSDFGVGLLSQPLYIVYKVAGLYKHFQLSCIAGISFVLISNQLSGVSFLTVALISADRALALYLHMRYNELLTIYRIKLALVAVWVLSASANVAWLTSLKVYYFIASSGFAIFLITTLFAYVMIFRTVRRHHLQIQQQSKAVSRLSTTSLQGNTNSEQNEAQRIMEQAVRFRQSAINMFLVYVIFLFCVLPLMCVLLISSVHGRDTTVETAFNFTMALVFINSTLNPFLYCFRMKNLRKEVWNTLANIGIGST